jgi:hypothetical protein
MSDGAVEEISPTVKHKEINETEGTEQFSFTPMTQ